MTTSDLPLLSICIPTYNRSVKLDYFLVALAAALNGISETVEIIISDNCSTDDTYKVAAAFVKNDPRVQLLRQEENIGAEGNFWFLWGHAAGKYVWIIGDDDLLEVNALLDVLAELKNDPDLLIINYSNWDSDLASQLSCSAYPEMPAAFGDMEAIVKIFGPDLAFISMSVLRHDLVKNITAENYRKLSVTGLSFMFGLYSCMRTSVKIRFLPTPVIRNRQALNVSYNWDRYFVSGMAEVFQALQQEGYSSNATRLAKKRVVRRYIFPVFKLRKASGHLKFIHIFNAMRSYADIPLSWLLILPLAIVPSVMINTLDKLRKKIVS